MKKEVYFIMLSTAAIENELLTFLSTAYSDLFREYILFTAAMLISCAVIPIFVVRMYNKRDRKRTETGNPFKAYTHRNTTPLLIHTVVKFLIPVFAVREMYYCLQLTDSMELYGVWPIVFCGFLVLLAIPAVVGLFRFRIYGLLTAGAFVFCFAAFEQYKNLLAAISDMQSQMQYNVIGQYTVYIVDDYRVTQSMAVSLMALVALTLLAVYYYKRRFLFMPGKLPRPTCRHCGQMIGKNDDFCTCCGRKVLIKPVSQIVTSLDRKKYCEKCGTSIHRSVCVKCENTIPNYLIAVARDKVGEVKKICSAA